MYFAGFIDDSLAINLDRLCKLFDDIPRERRLLFMVELRNFIKEQEDKNK